MWKNREARRGRPTAFISWGIGAAVALAVHLFAPTFSDAVTGLIVGLVVCVAIEIATGNRKTVRRKAPALE